MGGGSFWLTVSERFSPSSQGRHDGAAQFMCARAYGEGCSYHRDSEAGSEVGTRGGKHFQSLILGDSCHLDPPHLKGSTTSPNRAASYGWTMWRMTLWWMLGIQTTQLNTKGWLYGHGDFPYCIALMFQAQKSDMAGNFSLALQSVRQVYPTPIQPSPCPKSLRQTSWRPTHVTHGHCID